MELCFRGLQRVVEFGGRFDQLAPRPAEARLARPLRLGALFGLSLLSLPRQVIVADAIELRVELRLLIALPLFRELLFQGGLRAPSVAASQPLDRLFEHGSVPLLLSRMCVGEKHVVGGRRA